MHFSINFSAIICSPTAMHAILREATSETYGPRVYFTSYKFPIYNSSLLFILRSLFSNLYKKIPKIFILLSLSDLTFASGREGIDNPFIALVARFLIVCAGTRRLACSLLLDWYLGSQKLGEILTLLCCITLSSLRENQRMLKRYQFFISSTTWSCSSLIGNQSPGGASERSSSWPTGQHDHMIVPPRAQDRQQRGKMTCTYKKCTIMVSKDQGRSWS